ncbi:hypothetical protein RJ639_018365 [Escallonia herrerae]|uniref:Reverse transcriptase domain-containing protein n=1 Tax=Escallonia herrerae TaxID=1293975 RepID=A0AA88V6A2_9ASTE|nr:hypothetical protein RJ639_018365 [Escallonia herrerae]
MAHEENLQLNLVEELKREESLWMEISQHQKLLEGDHNNVLRSIPSDIEITQVLNQMGSHKAPGPEDMTSFFYKTYWKSTKDDLNKSVKSFYLSGFILNEQNHTRIAFIPKLESPTSVNHYRLISLCNNSYKIISNILASRLLEFLSKLISPLQAAFVPNRLINYDNNIIIQELWHTMQKKKGKSGLMAIKIDMEKVWITITSFTCVTLTNITIAPKLPSTSELNNHGKSLCSPNTFLGTNSPPFKKAKCKI